MKKLKYLITGTPRSGTQYMAKLFSSAGVPCSHELIYGMPGVNWSPDENIEAESSWLAVPHLSKIKCPIIHIVRNPLNVVSSLRKDGNLDGIFGQTIYSAYKFLTMPSLWKVQGIDRYLMFYIQWNRIIEQYADFRFKLEEVSKDPKKMFDKIGIDTKGKKLFKKVANQHHSREGYITDVDKINSQFKKEFKKIIDKYGY